MPERGIFRPGGLCGTVRLPGDKSISHRAAMLSAIAYGTSEIAGFSSSEDCTSTLGCLGALGVNVSRKDTTVYIEGHGIEGLRSPQRTLDAGNSATTVRLMSGVLAACAIEAVWTGDASLSSRPMGRVIEPLRRMGAAIEARDDEYLPMHIRGGALKAIDYTLPVASAQVKSSILIAGLHTAGTTIVREPVATRDHTERALTAFGAQWIRQGNSIAIAGGQRLRPVRFEVPGDISAAAFLVAAGVLVHNSAIVIENAALNPTRTAFIECLQQMGGAIDVSPYSAPGAEPAGTLSVRSSALRSIDVEAPSIPNLIDEIPILAILATQCEGGLTIRGASELRVKESDRIRSVVAGLRELGVPAVELPDGLSVPGPRAISGGRVQTHGDHRIALAFAVAGLISKGPVILDDMDCMSVSFPGFFETLAQLGWRP